MKKAALGSAFLLLACVASGQELKKGNLIGTHLMTVKLEPGVTLEKFLDYYNKTAIPAFEETRPGWKVYPIKRVRGEKADGVAMLYVVSSESERDKYYNPDGSDSALGKETIAKVQPVLDALSKLGTITADVYTDWVVY
jgi:hypothetical protein